jgi:hypothetical protein
MYGTDNLVLSIGIGLAIGITFIAMFAAFSANIIAYPALNMGQNATESGNALQAVTIYPGHHGGVETCLQRIVPISMSILNWTGFDQVVNNTLPYATDFVIPSGHSGSITYAIAVGSPHPEFQNSSRIMNLSRTVNFTNDVSFIHSENITVHQNVTYQGLVTLVNGTTLPYYEACYSMPEDTRNGICSYGPMKNPPPSTITVPVRYNTHKGVTVSAQSSYETLGFNETRTVKLTFAISPDAPLGTYWLRISPEICGGSPDILFTVGDKPYPGTPQRVGGAVL